MTYYYFSFEEALPIFCQISRKIIHCTRLTFSKKKSLRNNHKLNSLPSTLIPQAVSNYFKMVVNYCLNGQPASEAGAGVCPQQRISEAFENLFQKCTSVMCTAMRQKFLDKTRDSTVFDHTDVQR